MPISSYFVDFLCRELKLIVELDGESHDYTVQYDSRRDDYYRSQDYLILRFSNADVMENLEGVVSHVQATLAQAHPQPLPPAGGE